MVVEEHNITSKEHEEDLYNKEPHSKDPQLESIHKDIETPIVIIEELRK